MREYKPGDKIKRVIGSYEKVKEGQVYTISSIEGDSVKLEEVTGGYDITKFTLLETKQELIFESL